MKKIKIALGLYVLVFCSAFIIGSLNGVSGRDKGAMRFVLDNIYLLKYNDELVLAYSCQKETSHVFFIEEDVIEESLSQGLESIVGNEFENPLGSIAQNVSLLTAIAGGPSGYLTLSSLSKTTSKKKPNRIVYTILSALTGYSIGYWASSRFPLFCSSSAVRKILEKKSRWIQLEKAYILAFLDTMARDTRSTLYGKKPSNDDNYSQKQWYLGKKMKESNHMLSGSNPSLRDFSPEYDAFFYCQAQDKSDITLLHNNVRKKATLLKNDDFKRLFRLKQRLALAETTAGYSKLKTKRETWMIEKVNEIRQLVQKRSKNALTTETQSFKRLKATLQSYEEKISVKGEKSNRELCIEIENEINARLEQTGSAQQFPLTL